MEHRIIRSKIKKGEALMSDPLVARHIPTTDWYNPAKLKRMLRTYTTVYIKPDIGRKGNGVIRIKKLKGSVEISYQQTVFRTSRKKALQEIQSILNPKKNYIMQQGIELATYLGRPFDVRVVLQKPLNRWRLSLMTAKVAPRKASVVTNIAKGAKDVNVIRALHRSDQQLNAVRVMRDLIDLSYQVAQILGARFPLKIVGLDMGIDTRGKVWFIEANTRPDCTGLRTLDRTLYRRYREAKRLQLKIPISYFRNNSA